MAKCKKKIFQDWLDFKRVTDEQALATLKPATQLQWHRVSNIVNNSRNKSDQCNKPIELIKTQKPAMNKMMSAWLNVRKRKEAALAQSGSDVEDDEVQSIGAGSIGAGGTTSDSESEHLVAAKRPRFRDYKRALKNLHNRENLDELTSDANETNCESDRETKPSSQIIITICLNCSG